MKRIISFASIVGIVFLRAYVIHVGYTWFLAPSFGLPPVSIWVIAGALLTLYSVSASQSEPFDYDEFHARGTLMEVAVGLNGADEDETRELLELEAKIKEALDQRSVNKILITAGGKAVSLLIFLALMHIVHNQM